MYASHQIVEMRLESDALKIEPVHEFVLSTHSEYYRSLLSFSATRGESSTGQGPSQPSVVTIPSDITTDERVMKSFILFLYTGLIVDIGGRDINSIPTEERTNPGFSFDLVELFRLADFFRVMELMHALCDNFFSLSVMFGTMSPDMHAQEALMASIILSLSHTESDAIISKLVKTYIKGTGGLHCLCKWPTLFPRSTWDIMMKKGKSTCIFWAAHVLPLYVVRFDLDRNEAIKLLVDMEMIEWIDGSQKDFQLGTVIDNVNDFFFADAYIPGQAYVPHDTQVPDQRCIGSLYLQDHRIDLVSVYNEQGAPKPDEKFMDTYISLTHLICTGLQALCFARDSALNAGLPDFASKVLKGLVKPNILCKGSDMDLQDLYYKAKRSCFYFECFAGSYDSNSCLFGMPFYSEWGRVHFNGDEDCNDREMHAVDVEALMHSISLGMQLCISAHKKGLELRGGKRRKTDARGGGAS